jgi:hypothetical protein
VTVVCGAPVCLRAGSTAAFMPRGGPSGEAAAGDSKRTCTESVVRCIRRAAKVHERAEEAAAKYTRMRERFADDPAFPAHDGLLFFTKSDGEGRGAETDPEMGPMCTSLQFQSTDNSRRNIVFALKFSELLGIGSSFDGFLFPDALLMARRVGSSLRSICPDGFGLE